MARVLSVAWRCGHRSRLFFAELAFGAGGKTIQLECGNDCPFTDCRPLVARNSHGAASGASYAGTSAIDDRTHSRATSSVEAGTG